jgi:hypothetical protein
MNYGIDPGLSKASYLFSGVAASFVAVSLCALSKRMADERTNTSKGDEMEHSIPMNAPLGTGIDSASEIPMDSSTAPVSRQQIVIGIILALVSSAFLGGFFALFNLSTNPNAVDDRPLNTYTASLAFNVGCCSVAVVQAAWEQLVLKPPFPLMEEFRHMCWRPRAMLWLAGLLCTVSNLCTFLAGNAVGFAASGSVANSSPLVGALWGFLYWHEYDNTSVATKLVFVAMVVMYMLGIALICLSVA